MEEKRLLSQGKVGGENIISSLLRAPAGMAKSPTSAGTEGPGARGLTESEIYGIIFVYNFAGHDTIAITINYALYVLAVQECLRAVVGRGAGVSGEEVRAGGVRGGDGGAVPEAQGRGGAGEGGERGRGPDAGVEGCVG